MRIVLLTVISIWMFALMNCGAAPEKTNTVVNKNAAAPPAQNTQAPKTALKPGDITPDKAVTVKELVDAVAASPDGWTGKQVTVTAYVSATSESGPKNLLLTLMNDKGDKSEQSMSCLVQGSYDEVNDKVFDKTVEVKGTIKHIQGADAASKRVGLEPCEVKK